MAPGVQHVHFPSFCPKASECVQLGMRFMRSPSTIDFLEVIGGKGTSSEVRRRRQRSRLVLILHRNLNFLQNF